jgi:branched-chain amino acid transport system permease protein
MTRLLALAAILFLSACSFLDTEQARVCRLVLPALHPHQTIIREMQVAAPAGNEAATRTTRHAVRIDYTAQEGNERAAPHWAICMFEGGALTRGRLTLAGVDTDRGALGEARLLYLNRFWLADFAVATFDQASQSPPRVPQVPLPAAYAAQQLVNALALCAIYALLATAYALIYGLIGRLNLAFGEIAVVGAYGVIAGITATVALGVQEPLGALALGLCVGAMLAALWSWVIGALLVAPLHARFRLGQPILVATIAAAIAIQEFLRLTQGAQERWLPALFNEPLPLLRAGGFVVTATPLQFAITATATGAAVGVLLLLAKSRFGRAWRAFADDPGAAALFGVARERLIASTFALAGTLAGLAGWIVAIYYGTVSAGMGTMLGLKALVAAVVGGIGSLPGAFLGGILVGVIEAFWSAYFDIAFRDVVVFSLLIVMFVLRPGGLFGFASPGPRQV